MDLQIISSDISELQKNQATTVAKIAQYKRKLMDLSHRVLQVAASPFSLCSAKCRCWFLDFEWMPYHCVIFIIPPHPFLLSWQVLIKQEIQRKSGYAIQVDEEHLRVQLDTIQSELNAPTQFKASVSNKCSLTLLIFSSMEYADKT